MSSRQRRTFSSRSVIAKIEKDIKLPSASANTKVVDCSGKIISPGFINTHAHLWQTHAKGKHPNDTLTDYMPKGAYVRGLLPLGDVFWGQLAGAMESVDSGTTTVVDHAHINLTPDYRMSTSIPHVLSWPDALERLCSTHPHPGARHVRPAHCLLLLPAAPCDVLGAPEGGG